jgi:hypothetical protein
VLSSDDYCAHCYHMLLAASNNKVNVNVNVNVPEIFAVPSCSMIKPTNKNDSCSCGGFYVLQYSIRMDRPEKVMHKGPQYNSIFYKAISCLTSCVTYSSDT